LTRALGNIVETQYGEIASTGPPALLFHCGSEHARGITSRLRYKWIRGLKETVDKIIVIIIYLPVRAQVLQVNKGLTQTKIKIQM